MTLSTTARALTIGVAALNVADIALHVAIDDVEPLRIGGNVVVIVAALALLAWKASRRAVVPLVAAAVSLALNVVFIVREGIGPLGSVLVATTTVLLVLTALAVKRSNQPTSPGRST